jgi:hypothetical protein
VLQAASTLPRSWRVSSAWLHAARAGDGGHCRRAAELHGPRVDAGHQPRQASYEEDRGATARALAAQPAGQPLARQRALTPYLSSEIAT